MKATSKVTDYEYKEFLVEPNIHQRNQKYAPSHLTLWTTILM